MENHVFGSLAQLRILLLPVGPISKAAFDNYAGDIRSFEEIRLSDIPADTKDEKGV
jgi:trafficking protein particle complex subunit 9